MTIVDYQLLRSQMRAGDVIAFSGKGGFSRLIKWRLGGNVSHVGCVLHRVGGSHTRVELIESTSLYGPPRVQSVALSWHVDHYNGEMYWLPLTQVVRQRFDELAYIEAATQILGRPYDFSQAVLSSLPNWMLTVLSWVGYHEDVTRLFCSEAVAYLFEAAGILPKDENASGYNPREICELGFYGKPVQFKGTPKPMGV